MADYRRSSVALQSPIVGPRSRRGSFASIASSRAPLDREALAHLLDEIHTNASKSETLTSFSDFDTNASSRVSGAKDLVSGGITTLYTRLRQTVTAATSNSAASSPITSTSSPRRFSLTAASFAPRHLISTSVPVKTCESSLPPSIPEPALSSLNTTAVRPDSISPSPVSSRRRVLGLASHESSPINKHIPTLNHSPSALHALPSAAGQLPSPKSTPILDPLTRHSPALPAHVTSALQDDDDGDDTSTADELPPTQDDTTRHTPIVLSEPFSPIEAFDSLERKPHPTSDDASMASSFNTLSVPITQTAPKLSLPRISEKAPPTVNLSRTSSATDGASLLLENNTARPEQPTTVTAKERPPAIKRASNKTPTTQSKSHAVVPAHIKRRVVSKEFWMKDENAKDCFYCGHAFSAFRRKHHCRTCGQIFDSQCTVLVSGRPFDLPGSLRLCHPCEAVIYGSDDDSTDISDAEDSRRPAAAAVTAPVEKARTPKLKTEGLTDQNAPFKPEDAALATPSIGIPASRRTREGHGGSAVIEFAANTSLARPTSSRSLKSMHTRLRPATQRRTHPRQTQSRMLRQPADDFGPFLPDTLDTETRSLFPTFQNESVIDPDLAPFMSDEGSDEEQVSVFSVINSASQASSFADSDRAGLFNNGIHGGSRKGAQRPLSRQNSKLRRRNASIASMNFPRPSPRRSRSQNLGHIDLEEDRPKRGDRASVSPLLVDHSAHKIWEASIVRSPALLGGSGSSRVELNEAGLQHVRRLLAQLLQDSSVPSLRAWEKALLPILLQCTDDVDPNVQRGDDMDVRNYVKLKKVPGGRPADIGYVSGVVFSKNVALKSMNRNFKNPQILVVMFAVEYARHHQHFISLESVIAQEREYLRNLVGRVAALKPDVLLVHRNVSGLALDMLQDAGITVVYNVKESVLAAVARMTRTVMIRTVDKLSMDPSHLGRCASFDVKTYIHSGTKKSYIYVAGCEPSLGCTIVLRGGTMSILRRIKRITEFMCYVVYNLRLETCLLRDQYVHMPRLDALADQRSHEQTLQSEKLSTFSFTSNDGNANESHGASSAESVVIGPFLQVPPRQPQDDIMPLFERTEAGKTCPVNKSEASMYRDLVESSRTRLLSSSPLVKFIEPYLLIQAQEQEKRVEEYKHLRDQYSISLSPLADSDFQDEPQFELVEPEMITQARSQFLSEAIRRFLYDAHDVQYQRALKEYSAKRKQWESFYEGSNSNLFDPFTHQNIFVLQSLVSTLTSTPCAGPEVIGLSFYAAYEQSEMNYEDDCTLGQYVEDICLGANTTCKTCNKRMFDHHRQYVHGSGQLSVSVTSYPSRFKGMSDSILMWSTCRICNQETTVTPMSDSTWRYSFGKYLELSFWSTPLIPDDGLCPHDLHKDFVRCFGFQNQCVRVQYDNIEIYNVLVPSGIINWAVSADLKLKNQLYTDCVTKLSAFFDSVHSRLDSINLSSVDSEKSSDATNVLNTLRSQAKQDQSELLNQMQAQYMSSRFYEVVPLNRTLRVLEEKALAWDVDFADFERNYFPSETDIRRLATLQLKKFFQDRSEDATHDTDDMDDAVEMKERPIHDPSLTEEEMQSEKTRMLESVVEEQAQLTDGSHQDAVSYLGVPVPNDPLSSRQLSAQEMEDVVNDTAVQHLDLATTAINVLPPTPSSANVTDNLFSNELLKDIEILVAEPEPLNQDLVDRIEQIQTTTTILDDDTILDVKPQDSRIPRLINLPKPTAPELNRTQSQPVRAFPVLLESRPEATLMNKVGSPDSSDAEKPSGSRGSNILGGIGRMVEQKLMEKLGTSISKTGKADGSQIPRSVPQNANSSRVTALAKHFEQLSRDFERERLRERRMRAARTRRHRPLHVMSSQPSVEVYRDASEAFGNRSMDDRSPGSRPTHRKRSQSVHILDADKRQYAQSKMQEYYDRQDATDLDNTDPDNLDSDVDVSSAESEVGSGFDTPADIGTTIDPRRSSLSEQQKDLLSVPIASALASPTLAQPPDGDLTLPKHEKSSLMKMLSSFWSERSASGWAPLEYPLHHTEHVFDDSDIIVREDEPSSVIALALSSKDYTKKLTEFRKMPHTGDASETSDAPDDDTLQQATIEASLISETGTHMKYAFGHNQVRAQCKIFYAEAFDALRRKCGISERFVESLSRSVKWDSKGGKTRSLFLKTLDDRFVIKSLQEVELKAFTRFAPDYFAFMAHSLFHGVPSVIAKMFGVFQVSIKNPATGVEFNSYLLVMENLFYDRKPTRRFDLKGSMRNRKIESTGQPDEVLLDENLVETIFETPLFVREHARKLVKASVWNDTMWLCKQNVMDYSLMAGFDDEARTLTIGIIDCIRTYTWDKKLESWIKDRGKNKPTITSPKDYRNRFRVSMLQYVLQAPNVYHEFSKHVPAPVSLKTVEQERARHDARMAVAGKNKRGKRVVDALVDDEALWPNVGGQSATARDGSYESMVRIEEGQLPDES